jgi:hypothetical protein
MWNGKVLSFSPSPRLPVCLLPARQRVRVFLAAVSHLANHHPAPIHLLVVTEYDGRKQPVGCDRG